MNTEKRSLNILFLCTELSGYFVNCITTLKQSTDVHIQIVHWPAISNAPFQFTIEEMEVVNKNTFEPNELIRFCELFHPDIVYVAGWADKEYLKIAKSLRKKGAVTIGGLDNPWKATWRQRISCFLSPWIIKPYFDFLWVAGKKQYQFARKLQYQTQEILLDVYVADIDKFGYSAKDTYQKYLLYVGRFEPEKGVKMLVDVFLSLTEKERNGWTLRMIGNGSLRDAILPGSNIEVLDFMQPEELIAVSKDVSGFILPSFYEPWGVVVQEFAAAGLPLLLSDAVHSGEKFLVEGENGYKFLSNNPSSLKNVLISFSTWKKWPSRKWDVDRLNSQIQLHPTIGLSNYYLLPKLNSSNPQRVKILMIVPSYKPAYTYGGPVRAIAMLCEALSMAGHFITVFTTTANGPQELEVEAGKEYEIDGVRVTYFKRITKDHSNLSPQLLKLVNQRVAEFDIVHIHSWWNLVAIPGTWICLLKGVRPIISPRGTLTSYTFTHNKRYIKKMFHVILGKRLLNHSVLTFTSERERSESQKYAIGQQSYVIPNLLDLPNKIFGTPAETDHLKLVFLGRIDKAKNLELLFTILNKDFPVPYHLTVAGSGSHTYTQILKQRTSGNSNISWIGSVDGVSKYKLLAESDLLLLPSHTENFGNVVFEALSQSTPVVVSSNVGAKEYVIHNHLGWVVEGTEEEWRKSLVEIWQNKEMRQAIRSRAALCIANDFNPNEQVKSYVNMYTNHLHARIS